MNIPSEGKVVVQFGATWCAPCKRIRPLVEELAHAQEAEFIYVDCEANIDLARSMRVSSVPTVLTMKDGQELGRTGGAAPNQIRTIINGSFGS